MANRSEHFHVFSTSKYFSGHEEDNVDKPAETFSAKVQNTGQVECRMQLWKTRQKDLSKGPFFSRQADVFLKVLFAIRT